MDQDKIREGYLNKAEYYNNLEKKKEKEIVILSVLRFLVFTGGFIFAWIGFTENITSGVVISLIFISLFLFILKLFLSASEKKEFLSNLTAINQNEANALAGDLAAFNPGNNYIDTKHDFSFDIDLFGTSSLFQYLNRTVTAYGRDILANWLSDPFSLSGQLERRQETVREISLKDKWRQTFMASGMKTPLEREGIRSLIDWMDEKPTISSSVLYRFLLYFLPAAAILSVILLIAGILAYQVFIFIFLINLFFIATGLKKINRIHNSLTRKYNFLTSMKALLSSFENEEFSSPVMKNMKLNISGKTNSASGSVRQLGKLIQAFDSRNNMLIGAGLNGFLLWDYHCVSRLEKWKSDYKLLFPVWLEMIGEVDAYISLGNYAFNNPGFVYPVESEEEIFSARNLGHQLIEESKRVCNDFSLGKKGTICIISGANMAGKSTFLRTVAVNFILAMTGAPVCASEMNFIPAKLFTSMRTMDSLSANESYFYAELRRLNLLKKRIEEGGTVLFILDEILKGTNSSDKSTGSRLFLQRLAERHGTGLLATHDTSLGKMEEDFPGVIINKCFEIEIDGEILRFDYKIRDGITQKMNAVFLMKQMGILD